MGAEQTFERAVEQTMFTASIEKSFLDKIFAREDVVLMRTLMKKESLTRAELLELLYMTLSTESKLVNYSAWERYIMLKFFVWIRDFIKIAELRYDYMDKLAAKRAAGGVGLSKRAEEMLKNSERLMEHNIKFVIDLYMNIARTSLSLGATGFREGLTNKFEMSYPQQNSVSTPVEQKRGWSLFGGSGGGGHGERRDM